MVSNHFFLTIKSYFDPGKISESFGIQKIRMYRNHVQFLNVCMRLAKTIGVNIGFRPDWSYAHYWKAGKSSFPMMYKLFKRSQKCKSYE